MNLPDYHTHTIRCGHASGRPSEYVEAARAIGLAAIGVADHLPLLPDRDPQLSMDTCELSDYVAEVQELQASFPEYVLLGVEADYRPHTVSEVAALLDSSPFDYVIGSVHHLGGWGFDDPRQLHEYADRDIDDVWIEYFELVGDAAESGLFTIIGHLDLVKKFGYLPTRTLKAELDRLVERLAKARVLVEINTAGLHRPVGEAYPTLDILRRLCAAGVAVTFGSDAHRPQEVGRDFDHAVALAQAAGYREFASLVSGSDGGRALARLEPLLAPAASAGRRPSPPRGTPRR